MKDSAGSEVVDAVRQVSSGRRYVSQKVSNVIIDSQILGRDKRRRDKSPLEKLSAREREILQLVVEGRSSANIAAMLRLSPKTVETYRSRLMQKLGVHGLPSLVRFAILHGIISAA